MKRIGIAGAGIMAGGMALNFLKHGYEVRVWNRSPERLKALLQKGVRAASSPKALTEQSDIVVECVSDDDASRSVWLEDDGILAGAHADVILITSATLSLFWTDELAEICHARNLKFLDMPLIGSRPGAENGELTLLVGGKPETLDAIREDLAAISSQIFHLGGAGAGMRFKLLHNALIAIQVDAAARAAALAGKAGIGKEVFLETLIKGNLGPASPAVRQLVTNKDMPGNHVNWAVRWVEKDLRYAKGMAGKYHTAFDMLDSAHQDFSYAKEHGLADADWTKITEVHYHHGGHQ